MARLLNDAGDIKAPAVRVRFTAVANELLNSRHPGEFNQAMMELGATICTPRNPRCAECPVAAHCAASAAGTQQSLPVRKLSAKSVDLTMALLWVEKRGKLLLQQRPADASIMPGFWELPEVENVTNAQPLTVFHHQITFRKYECTVFRGDANPRKPARTQWFTLNEISQLPLATVTRKAMRRIHKLFTT